MSVYRPATKTQLAQIGDICRRRGIPIPSGIDSMTREDGDRLVRALLYIDGERGSRGRMPGVEMEVDLDLVHQLEASREEKPPMTEETKTCNECGETKPATEFYKGSAKCKPCYLDRQKRREAARKAEKKGKAQPEPESEPALTPADEDLDLPEKDTDAHWCIAELRDPRLSTIQQAQKILVAKFGDVGLQDTAEVLEQIADLDL